MLPSHRFSEVPSVEIPRSQFDRSHGVKSTFDVGKIIPFYVDEALPGDTFNLNASAFGRVATPIFPIMDNLYMDTFFFSVPIRLVWDNWQKFCGEQVNPGDSIDYTVPTVTAGGSGFAEGSLEDYFGIPTKIASLEVNALWHRAYNLVYNEWFRDQNLRNSLTVQTDDGPDTASNYITRDRAKRHDYFTSALPWPQKGDAVSLPLGTSAPVHIPATGGSNPFPSVYVDFGTPATYKLRTDGTAGGLVQSGLDSDGDENELLYANLADATAATINQLRQAFQIQRMLERDARGGTRYIEILKSHFGVTSPDQRVQRPEYLGGGSQMINITPVAQTSSTDATTPQGNLAAMGTVSFNGHGFTKSFVEHCLLLGVVSVRGEVSYQQGLHRMFSRQTRYDFFWPALSHIGEQAILSKEIYADGTVNDDDVFGYQERYAEYRYKPSLVTGLFRSNATASLDAWHVAQEFTSRPTLNVNFIIDGTAMDRVIATPAEPHILFDSWINIKCARPMPLYGVPGMLDHF